MATARKLPSGQWRTLIYSHTENGKRIYESFTADTKRESEYLATQYKLFNKKTTKITVENVINRYLEVKKDVLSPKTYREYLAMSKNRYTDISKISINKLDDDILQEWISSLSLRLSPKTVKNTYSLLLSSIKMFDAKFMPNITLPQNSYSNIHVPTDDDIKNLFTLNKDNELEIAMLLAAFGSLRRSEGRSIRIFRY